VWDKDFAEMAAHGVSFVRTGVWMPNAKFIDPATGGVNERFLRNLEAFLDCAQRHHIAINFTFFAFSPRSGPLRRPRTQPHRCRIPIPIPLLWKRNKPMCVPWLTDSKTYHGSHGI